MKFKVRRYLLYYLGRALAFLFCLMPLRAGLVIGGFLGRAAYHLLPEYRNITIDNLDLAFGKEKSPSEIKRIAKDVFRNLGKNAAELVNFPKINEKNIGDFVLLKNRQILDEAFRKGRGIIIITAHIGNWELMAAALRLNNYPGVTVGRKIYFDKYDKYLNYLRKTHDVNVIYRDDSPRKILKVLKENRIVGIVADQDVDSVEGVFVNFFGLAAYTPSGPAAIARATGAALIPVFIIRKNGRHELVIEEPIELVDTGDKPGDIIKNTQKWSDVIESYIRRYPEQWVWMHRRWKTKPV
ncbi:MAG: lysophospholipid acyltransferase family protein [Candidatus Omnitrophica bacterium]|nr:lysophospholipid acyltransferase family protein [Candidatus Omnitrophota bacterium]